MKDWPLNTGKKNGLDVRVVHDGHRGVSAIYIDGTFVKQRAWNEDLMIAICERGGVVSTYDEFEVDPNVLNDGWPTSFDDVYRVGESPQTVMISGDESIRDFQHKINNALNRENRKTTFVIEEDDEVIEYVRELITKNNAEDRIAVQTK